MSYIFFLYAHYVFFSGNIVFLFYIFFSHFPCNINNYVPHICVNHLVFIQLDPMDVCNMKV